jgi:hypothetical protein
MGFRRFSVHAEVANKIAANANAVRSMVSSLAVAQERIKRDATVIHYSCSTVARETGLRLHDRGGSCALPPAFA